MKDAKHWRDRAEEIRVLAGLMTDDAAGATLLKIAFGYDQLAEQAEHGQPMSGAALIPSPRPAQMDRGFLGRHLDRQMEDRPKAEPALPADQVRAKPIM